MRQLILILTILGTAFTLALSLPVLEIIGWKSLTGNNVTKIHPGFYVMLIATLCAALSQGRAYWRVIRQPQVLFYLIASAVLFARALVIAASGVTQGEFSAVPVTWITPILILICYAGLSDRQLDQFGNAVRIFFVINSLVGLAERALGRVFFDNPMIAGVTDDRASALLGHPLNSSMLTGILIVYLVTAPRKDLPIASRLPELLLHGVAMFAFGGRSALVFTVAVAVFSALDMRQRRNEVVRVTALQRALPLMILALGALLIFTPLPFVDATLERFTNDGGSAKTRDAAVAMFRMMEPHELLFGIDANRRMILQNFFETPYGIELAWIAMTLTYGIVFAIPMFIALVLLLLRVCKGLDRSATYMALLFMLVTAGSLSIASKTMLIAQTMIMMLTLSRRRLLQIDMGASLFSEMRAAHLGDDPATNVTDDRSISTR